jgi:hypothetical protein
VPKTRTAAEIRNEFHVMFFVASTRSRCLVLGSGPKAAPP